MRSIIHTGKTLGVLQEESLPDLRCLSVLIVASPTACPYPFNAPGNSRPVLIMLTNTSCFHVEVNCQHFSCITVYVFI